MVTMIWLSKSTEPTTTRIGKVFTIKSGAKIEKNTLFIDVFAYNENAIKFYEKLGFHTRGLIHISIITPPANGLKNVPRTVSKPPNIKPKLMEQGLVKFVVVNDKKRKNPNNCA